MIAFNLSSNSAWLKVAGICLNRPLIYGKTTVDLKLVPGSALVVSFLTLVISLLQERKTITIGNKNLEIIDHFVIRHLAHF